MRILGFIVSESAGIGDPMHHMYPTQLISRMETVKVKQNEEADTRNSKMTRYNNIIANNHGPMTTILPMS